MIGEMNTILWATPPHELIVQGGCGRFVAASLRTRLLPQLYRAAAMKRHDLQSFDESTSVIAGRIKSTMYGSTGRSFRIEADALFNSMSSRSRRSSGEKVD